MKPKISKISTTHSFIKRKCNSCCCCHTCSIDIQTNELTTEVVLTNCVPWLDLDFHEFYKFNNCYLLLHICLSRVRHKSVCRLGGSQQSPYFISTSHNFHKTEIKELKLFLLRPQPLLDHTLLILQRSKPCMNIRDRSVYCSSYLDHLNI